jgi:hypothetical protein
MLTQQLYQIANALFLLFPLKVSTTFLLVFLKANISNYMKITKCLNTYQKNTSEVVLLLANLFYAKHYNFKLQGNVILFNPQEEQDMEIPDSLNKATDAVQQF